MAESCKFGTLHDEMVRDCLILGCCDKGAKAQLFREKECTLKKALEALQISEAMYEQLKNIGGEDNPIPINALDQHKKSAKPYTKHDQRKNPTLPASIVEENMKRLEHGVQHMGKAVTCVAKLIIFT